MAIKVLETDVGDSRVTGTIANLAAASAVNVLFDLGQDWEKFPLATLVVSPIGPSTGLSNVQVSFRPDAVATFNISRRSNFAYAPGATAVFISPPTASGPTSFTVRVLGRYLVLAATNADATNAMGATARVCVALHEY
jgi:hypothetical protein